MHHRPYLVAGLYISLLVLPSCLTRSFWVSRRNEITNRFFHLKSFRFPRDIVAYVVWVYHRFMLSTADVEELLAERGVIISP